MAAPITYQELQQKLLDIKVPDSELREYLEADPDKSGAFNLVLRPKPGMVAMTFEEVEAENAMSIGNGLARVRRQIAFKVDLSHGNNRPVLVAEGDSWFQFPILIDDVIDQLWPDYLVWCVSAAGDTAQNMVFGQAGDGMCEYMDALREQKDRVKAFLFSGAGNDIIGADSNGVPVLSGILKQHIPGGTPAEHIDFAKFSEKLAFLKGAYEKMVMRIHADPAFEKLPIVIHGYDYVIPGRPGDPDDSRNPPYAKKDEWLGGPLVAKGIIDRELQRGILRLLIDGLYDLLYQIAASHPHVHVVDVRKTLLTVKDWNDEIHGTSAGFKLVSKKFKAVIDPLV